MAEPKDVVLHKIELELESNLHYGLSLSERSFSLIGPIDEDMYKDFDRKLTMLESQGRSKITIRINSCGGSIYDAMAIVGRIQSSPAHVVTEGVGAVMSAATIILAAGKKRRLHSMASFMWHEFSSESAGTINQTKHAVKQTEIEFERWCEYMARHSNVPSTYWLQQGRNQIDLYLTAEQCLQLGVVDEIF